MTNTIGWIRLQLQIILSNSMFARAYLFVQYCFTLFLIFKNSLKLPRLTQMYVIIAVMTVAMISVRIKVITNVIATATSVDNEPVKLKYNTLIM